MESVYLRRSAAAGEVSFGRSDIDLGIVLRDGDAGRALELARAHRRLKLVFPWLGESQAQERRDLARWIRTDPYRGSLDRRSGRLLYGNPLDIPKVPIRPEHAAMRVVFWLESYAPTALRQGNRRNMRKFLLEIANAYATATGLIEEPYRTRRETEEGLRGGDIFAGGQSLEDSWLSIFRVGQMLHQKLAQPLGRLRSAIELDALLPPTYVRRRILVAPDANRIPEGARGALTFTPELLDLYVQHFNPFAYWVLPPSLRDLGIRQPSVRAFVRGCRYHAAMLRLRGPGFFDDDTAGMALRFQAVEHTIEYLRENRVPDALELRRGHSLAFEEYYMSAYPALFRRAEELWNLLDGMSD